MQRSNFVHSELVSKRKDKTKTLCFIRKLFIKKKLIMMKANSPFFYNKNAIILIKTYFHKRIFDNVR